jgi:hypothetical protein
VTLALNDTPLSLHATDTAVSHLWAQLAQLSHHLNPNDWLLVGGQMVALHCHLAGMAPGRITTDIDVVANVLVTAGALHSCREAARALGLEPRPSADQRRQHRFANDSMVLDVMIPDHVPKHLRLRLAGRDPVPIAGGARALQRSARCFIDTSAGRAEIPLPDLQGALVLKARAWVADARDRDRHLYDLAQLAACVRDPLTLAGQLDGKERRALGRVDMPVATTRDPWLRIADTQRADALEAWLTITQPRQ